jgi:sulfur carrier protein
VVLIVNGERQEVGANTIPALLDELGYEAGFLAIAVNQEVVPRRRWAERGLAEGDSIEIVTPRQGG